MSGNCTALFCVGCSSFSDKLARMKTLRTLHHKSGRETVCLCLWESYIEYFLCHAIWLHVKLTCRVGIPACFNKRKQNKRYGEKTIPLVFYVDMFVGKYSRKQSNRGGGNEKWRTKKALLGLFSFSIEKRFWRRHPDLNWGSRCCRPLPYHLAIAPIGADYEARTRYLHLGKVALYQMS